MFLKTIIHKPQNTLLIIYVTFVYLVKTQHICMKPFATTNNFLCLYLYESYDSVQYQQGQLN